VIVTGRHYKLFPKPCRLCDDRPGGLRSASAWRVMAVLRGWLHQPVHQQDKGGCQGSEKNHQPVQ